MQPAPIPKDEKERLVSLYNLSILDTQNEERFDVITRTATVVFGVPISTLALIDSKREWFKSCVGLSQKKGNRTISFCGHALLSDDVFLVSDTTKDVRFKDNPMVTGVPYLRFYAGAPIFSADGKRIGVFCIKDTKPRKFSKNDQKLLKGLASWAEVEINSQNLNLYSNNEGEPKAEIEFYKKELDNLIKSHEELRKALVNVMEDLQTAERELDFERAKNK